MPYLIGTDEAGYGPNLGPLVVSATVWEVPDGVSHADLRSRLAAVINDSKGTRNDSRVAIADSKILYQSGKGLQHLEAGLWAALKQLQQWPTSWQEVWAALAPGADTHYAKEPWFAGFNLPVPLDADPEKLSCQAAVLKQGLHTAGVRLVAMKSRAIFPAEFNQLLRVYESKGTLLSHATLELAAKLIACLPKQNVSVVCDKHGGRSHYQPLLANQFPEWLIEIHGEGPATSIYQFGPAHHRIEFRFQVGGETYIPTALASMASKYLRELAMRAWNDFWCPRVPSLRPTAGYPEDARRFKQAIAATQAALGIEDALIWREK